MVNMIQDIAKLIFNPILIIVIILIFLLKYWSNNLNIMDSNYQKFVYISGILITGFSFFGFGNLIPKLTQNIREQNKINFEKKFINSLQQNNIFN
jgi:Na+/melibiose symporter-like transporter